MKDLPLISEDMKYFKVLFPSVWFGGLVLFALNDVYLGTLAGSTKDLFGLALLAAIGYVVMKSYLFDLVSEVYDCGDSLLIKNRNLEDYVALSNIVSIDFSNMNPPRISLQLASPSVFGTKIAFAPVRKFSINPFATNAIAKDLIARVGRARTQHAV